MASEKLHERRDDLPDSVLDAHRAFISLIEELDAVDWYNQRSQATGDEALKEILIHNMQEEIEHACMTLEWIRRTQDGWNEKMRTYLFKEENILDLEEQKETDEPSEDLKIGRIKKEDG